MRPLAARCLLPLRPHPLAPRTLEPYPPHARIRPALS
jgi:hypothetical protein